MPLQLRDIFYYPLKSGAAIATHSAVVTQTGLAHDRQLMLVDADGQFITAREYPQLLKLKVFPVPAGYALSFAGELLEIDLNQLHTDAVVEVWGATPEASLFGKEINHWLTARLGVACRLAYFGTRASRFTKRRPNQAITFVDGYPLLLAGTASLKFLQEYCGPNLSFSRFRPNLVVETTEPFEEDGWRRIRIGDVELEIVKPCARCVLTTHPTDDSPPLSPGEPLETLSRFRQDDQGEVFFGQNLCVLKIGVIETNSSVEILARQNPESYPDRSQLLSVESFEVSIDKPAITVQLSGNQTLLTSALQQGIDLPHQCGSGRCGRCKMHLTHGEVYHKAAKALSAEERSQGKILTCSAYPKTDLALTQDV